MKRVLHAALIFAALGGAARAMAYEEQPFTPSIDRDVRPWEEGHNELPAGMGERAGRAALPGKDRLLIVQPKDTTQVFLTDRTKVVDANGQSIARDGLTEGAQIRVDFDVIGNTAIARRVTVLAPPEPVPAP